MIRGAEKEFSVKFKLKESGKLEDVKSPIDLLLEQKIQANKGSRKLFGNTDIMSEYLIRKSETERYPFLADVVIASEKRCPTGLSFTTLFNKPEEEVNN